MIEWEELTDGQKEAVRLISERSFLKFMQIWFQITQGMKMMTNWHHIYMCSMAEEVVKGERGNTIINVPPGATKTETWSIFFPAWSQIQDIAPSSRQRYLSISFSDSLVERNSDRIRDMIKLEEWQNLWPCTFGKDQSKEWRLSDDKGKTLFELVSRSSGGQITGGRGGFPGADFSGSLLLDDFSKPEDMFSQVKRKRQDRILVDTVRSRRGDKSKEHPTPIISVQQRLHQQDATGFMMDGGMGLSFDQVVIPALITKEYIDNLPEPHRSNCWNAVKDSECVRGYYSFWPEMEDIGQLMDLWENNEYTFMSQYMQTPIALGGQMFDPSWWVFYGDVDNDGADIPKPAYFEYRFITADTAQKKGQHNDYSVFCEWAVHEGKIYLIDMLRGKFEAPELRSEFKAFVKGAFAKNDLVVGSLRGVHVEDKSSGTGLIQDLKTELPVPITPIQRSIDKVTRAYDTTPQVKAGKVCLPRGEKWVVEFVAEHSQFTIDDSHDNDDMVDNTMDAVDIGLLKVGSAPALLIPSRRR